MKGLWAVLASCTLLLCGCASTRDLRQLQPTVAASGTGTLLIAAVDQRPYVLNGQKNPAYFGVERSLAGIPYDIRTRSKQPLVKEMADAMCRSLSKNGFDCRTEVLPGTDVEGALPEVVARTNPAQVLLLEVAQWKNEIYLNSNVLYDMNLSVRTRDNRTVARTALKGEEKAVGAQKYLQEQLTRLLADPQINLALTHPSSAVPVAGLEQPRVRASPAPRAAPTANGVEDRLRKLDDLKRKGLITEREYQDGRRAILEQL